MIQTNMKVIQGKIYMRINLMVIKTKISSNKVFMINNLLINLIKRIILIKRQINFPINSRLSPKKTFLMQNLLQLLINSKLRLLIKKQILMQNPLQLLIKNKLKRLIKKQNHLNKSLLTQLTNVLNFHQKKAQEKVMA